MQRQELPVTQRGDLTDEQWNQIYPYLPVERKGRPFDNVRDTVNGILWVLRTGSLWRDLPPVYRKWNTIYKCFAKWEQTGVFESMFKILSEDADMQDVSIDSSCCKAHRHSAGAKKGADFRSEEHIGMTREGRNTKIHAMVNGLGNPLYIQLTSGQISDITVAYGLLEHVDVSGSVVMADKAYRVAEFRVMIAKSGATYCIPPKSNTAEPWKADWWQYKERSQVECFFQKLKNYRCIATQYDKLAVQFPDFVHLVCILVWLM